MGKNAFKWLITTAVTVAFTTSGWAQTVDPGQIEFLSSCAPCPGAEGKGKGPMSAALKATPPDLRAARQEQRWRLPLQQGVRGY
jgi:hypothetical protein